MPAPRKVDLLPADLRDWLREELVARGFGDYEQLADALNNKLALSGSTMTIQKSAIHRFGSEYQEFVRVQEEAGDWVKGFMLEVGMDGEAERHSALFQMLTALAFKTMKSQMESDAPDPKDLAFLGKMLKDVMASSGMRQKLLADEEKRMREAAAAEAAQAAAQALSKAKPGKGGGNVDPDALLAEIRNIMGVK